MDNNKIMDNLNFIKIYFKEFIHKIIVPKKFELSGKEIKNHRLRMKTRLGARTRLKNPRNWVQKALEHERTFNIQEHYSALLECRSLALQKCQIGSFWVWPNFLWVIIRHTLFDIFAEGWVLNNFLNGKIKIAMQT